MRDWIKLFEDFEDDGPSDYDREREIEAYMTKVCRELGLSLLDHSHPVNYSSEERELIISPDNDFLPLEVIEKFKIFGKVGASVNYGRESILIVIKDFSPPV
jgi:hypothetical protein